MTFVCIVIALYDQIGQDLLVDTCKGTHPLELWATIVIGILADSILAVRTWVVWNVNKVVGVGLLVLMLVNAVLQCMWSNGLVRSFGYAPAPYMEMRGCFFIHGDLTPLWKGYVVWAIVQFVLFVLMAASAFRSYQWGNASRLWQIIHMDGILFYVFVLCLSIANIIVMNVLPVDLAVVLSPLETILYSSLAMRIILDIRNTVHGGALQTAQEAITSIQFCSIGYTRSSRDMAESEGSDDNGT